MRENLTHVEPILTPHELQTQIPLTSTQTAFVRNTRISIQDILKGRNSKHLFIVGPCSIHNIVEAKELARRLGALAERFNDRMLIVMRTYFEKPRTGVGWKGMIYDPGLDDSHQIQEGLIMARRFLINLADMKLPAATEFLDPITPYYLGDLISWGCIGARTSASQIHRQMASSLDLPIGFKNSTDGDINTAVNGVLAASKPQVFIGMNTHGKVSQIQSTGNTHCHVVLRGSETGTNFDEVSINHVVRQLKTLGLTSRLLVDCSHGNSQKNFNQQETVFQRLIEQILSGSPSIAGLLLESYLHAGCQPLSGSGPLRYGISLTDPCLDWDSTETLLHWAYERLGTTTLEPRHHNAYAE